MSCSTDLGNVQCRVQSFHFVSIKATLGSDCCDILLSSSGSCRWIWGSCFIHQMVLWSFGNLSHSVSLSLWEEAICFCLTPISTLKSTPWIPLSKTEADEGQVGLPGGEASAARTEVWCWSPPESREIASRHFHFKAQRLACAQRTHWARCSDTMSLSQFSPQTCKQGFSTCFSGQETEAQRSRDWPVT